MAIKLSGSTIIDDSRNIVAAAGATFTGNVNVEGTLSYEDVTNIDAVGVITAQSGINVTGGSSAILTRINIGASDLNNRAVNAISNSASAGSVSANNHNSGGVLFQGYNSSVDPNNATFVVQSNGTTGIGTASADYKFHVNEDGGSSIAGLFETNQTDSFVSFQASGTTASSTVRIGAQANDFTAFINGAERLRITSAGKVGIGTADPDTPLHIYYNDPELITVERTSTANSTIRFRNQSGSMYAGLMSDATGFAIDSDNNIGASPMFIVKQSNGNVGMGTEDPDNRLHVRSTSGTVAQIESTNASSSLLRFVNGTAGNVYIGAKDTNDFFIRTGAAERVRVIENGNFGIGTTVPSSILNIAGNGGTQTITYGDNSTGYFISNTAVNRSNANAAIHQYQFRWNGTKVAQINVRTGTDTTNKDDGYFTFDTASAGTTEERLRITSTGKVGIGTEDPATLLHVYGSSATEKLITLGGGPSNRNNYIGINASDNLEIGADEDDEGADSSIRFRIDGSEKVRITSGGVLSVGVVGEDWDSTYKALQIGAGSLVGQAEGDGSTTNWSNNAYYDDTNNRWEYIAADQASQISQVDGITIFRTAAAGTADAALTWTETMRLTADGKLGINANNPGGQLCVSDASTYTVNIGPNGGDGALVSTLGGSASLALGTDSAERLRITSAGRVGIATNDPQSQLDIRGTGGNRSGIRLYSDNEAVYQYFSTNDADSNFIMSYAGTGSAEIALNSEGSVTFNQNCLVGQTGSNDGPLVSATGGSNALCLGSNSLERMRVDSNGNIGIATENPSKPLDVVGEILAQSATTTFIRCRTSIGNANDSHFAFEKSRGGSTGTLVATQDNDNLGTIDFMGYNGSDFNGGARIRGQQEGAVTGGNQVPGRLIFQCRDTGGTFNTNMTIEADRTTQINGDLAIAANLVHVNDTDTKMTFTNNNITFDTNGSEVLKLDSSQAATFEGNLSCKPGSSVTPADNGELTFEATNNTTLTFKLKGSDGTVRSGTLTLS